MLDATHSTPPKQLTVPTKPLSKSLLEVLHHATVLFPSDLSAHELFVSENDEAIQQKMVEIQTKNPDSDLVGGGLRNKALKELWAKADKDLWQSKIDTFVNNIDAYVWPTVYLQ